MPVGICPACYSRYTYEEHSGDYVHECNSGNATLDNEDVVVVGDWADYSGSADVAKSYVSVAGEANKLQGTDAAILGAKDEDRTSRGNRTATTRTRQRLTYIKLDD